jgi:hypothetical protein
MFCGVDKASWVLTQFGFTVAAVRPREIVAYNPETDRWHFVKRGLFGVRAKRLKSVIAGR